MVEDEAATARSVREHRDAAHPITLKTNDLKLAAIRNPRHSWGTGATAVSEPAWKVANRAHWDELVAVHLGPRGYNLTNLRERRGRLNAIEEAELWPVDGQYILHLQCHFGADTLTFAQRGATVVGLDFLPSAIFAAGQLADELGLAGRARFVQADLYDAPTAIPEPAAFDMVFVSWGAIGWLPNIRRWAEIVAHFLKPGGSLYLAEAHPAAGLR
jgi:SAM-dependent methyltransferase